MRFSDKAGMSSLVFVFVFWTALASLADSEGPRTFCQLDEKQKSSVAKCQHDLNSLECDDAPSEKKKDCFDFSDSAAASLPSHVVCAKGTYEGVKDGILGAADIISNAYHAVTNNKGYQTKVKTESREACEKDKDVLRAREKYKQISENIGKDMAASNYSSEMNNVYTQCLSRQERKGNQLGISFDLPKSEDLKSFLNCLSPSAQTEMACKVIGPMVLGGAAGAAVKTAVKTALRKNGMSAAGKVEKAYKSYIDGVKGELSVKELESLKHQKDLLTAINNPEVAARIQSAGVDLEALTKGILDSDYGKLGAGQKLLMEASSDSDRLLNILKGKDTTRAGAAYRKHMDEIGQPGKADFPQYSNKDIRKIISERPILAGQLHELPGMSLAIRDFDAGRITERQLIDRLNANRGHNHSPESTKSSKTMSGNEVVPFWDDLESKFIPGALKGDPLREKFFAGTVYDGGVATADGVIIPKYPPPTQKSVFVHSVFDRLSQGTGGGNVKIFYETAGKAVADNPSIPFGEIPDLTNFGKKNGLNNLAAQLTGTVVKLENGTVVQAMSNAERTNVQFRGLQQAISKSKYLDSEKSALSELTRAGRDRNLAFDEFAKNHIDSVKDANGNILKISFKDSEGNYLGTISKETPVNDGMKIVEKFNRAEERYNGDPFKDLLNPRILSKAEVAAYNLPSTGAYYHCQKKKQAPASDEKPYSVDQFGTQ